jgi:2-aminoethylphosphonate-pyruvate transaminase
MFIDFIYGPIDRMDWIYGTPPGVIRPPQRARLPFSQTAAPPDERSGGAFPMTEPYLLTPGPLTTSRTVKEAMLRDWGSRDGAFIALNRRIRARLVELANAAGSHVAIPVQGSGTFAVEAMIGTLVPRDGKLLVLVNGAYGKRIQRMAEVIGRRVVAIEVAEDQPVNPATLDEALTADADITHVAVVHCETTSGILNPVEAVADTVARHGRRLLIDSMSAFGALPLDAARVPFEAVAASANKCLEGVPGMGFVIARADAMAAAKGSAHSLSLDLHDQWRGFEANAQWRFTPPTHVLAAFGQALDEHEAEGGVAGRGARYAANGRILIDGMRALGFETLLPDALQAPIIVTFRMPADPAFVFDAFYDQLRERGFVIYPGKLTVADSFRIGCIGRLGAAEMRAALNAIRATLDAMGVASGAP